MQLLSSRTIDWLMVYQSPVIVNRELLVVMRMGCLALLLVVAVVAVVSLVSPISAMGLQLDCARDGTQIEVY